MIWPWPWPWFFSDEDEKPREPSTTVSHRIEPDFTIDKDRSVETEIIMRRGADECSFRVRIDGEYECWAVTHAMPGLVTDRERRERNIPLAPVTSNDFRRMLASAGSWINNWFLSGRPMLIKREIDLMTPDELDNRTHRDYCEHFGFDPDDVPMLQRNPPEPHNGCERLNPPEPQFGE
ncbi:hypothetical protein [Anatilimnocola floriformis]|uniref:hypothetical protein n=1 Tax=Anatilimnocola floriformis TaxID=2948575 RepID=UPI0020C57D78|nr:hypothetical protein [Anatilimnocola floriformis]